MGALTLKTFSDELREWEFIESESIDPTDSFGVGLRLSIRENQIFLAEPSSTNVPWITDRGRLFFDGMFEKNKIGSKIEWRKSFQQITELIYFADHLNLQKIAIAPFFFTFENISMEILNLLYLLNQQISMIQLRKAENFCSPTDVESDYQLNDTIKKLKLESSTLAIILSTNTRFEGYLLNLSLRQRFLKGNFRVFTINSILDLTFPLYNLGASTNVLKFIGEGTHLICQDLKSSTNPLLITSSEMQKRSDNKVLKEVLKYSMIINKGWSGHGTLQHSLSSTGIASLNQFMPISSEDYENFFAFYFVNTSLNAIANVKQLVNYNLLNRQRSSQLVQEKLYIDQGNSDLNKLAVKNIHSCSTAYSNYFYFPNSLFSETSETYINTQGHIRRTTKLLHFKNVAKTDWQLLRKFYNKSKKMAMLSNQKDSLLIQFDANNLFNYRNYSHFHYQASQSLTSLSFYLYKYNKPFNPTFFKTSIKFSSTKFYNSKVKSWLDDFFLNESKDFYSSNSSIMAQCSKIARINMTNFF